MIYRNCRLQSIELSINGIISYFRKLCKKSICTHEIFTNCVKLSLCHFLSTSQNREVFSAFPSRFVAGVKLRVGSSKMSVLSVDLPQLWLHPLQGCDYFILK